MRNSKVLFLQKKRNNIYEVEINSKETIETLNRTIEIQIEENKKLRKDLRSTHDELDRATVCQICQGSDLRFF